MLGRLLRRLPEVSAGEVRLLGLLVIVLILSGIVNIVVRYREAQRLDLGPVLQFDSVEETTADRFPRDVEPLDQRDESSPARININTASSRQLRELPGIGLVIADRIVAYRQEHGPFKSTRDLVRVSGIGRKKLAAIEPLVTVGGPASGSDD